MKNTLLILGGAVAVYYLLKKSKTPTEAEVSTRPMLIADPMMGDVQIRPTGSQGSNPINLPNLGIKSRAQSGVGSGVICERNGKISGCVKMCAEGDKVVGNCTLSSSLARR